MSVRGNHGGNNARWTEDCEAYLRSVWGGALSASQIAGVLYEKFGFEVTRNGVVGKAHRMGLSMGKRVMTGKYKNVSPGPRSPRPRVPRKPPVTIIAATSPAAVQRKARNEARAAASAQVIADQASIVPGQLPVNAVKWMDREEHQCAWPVAGTGAAMMCCGNKTMIVNSRRISYCAMHSRAGTQALTSKR